MTKENQQNIKKNKLFYQSKISELTQAFDKLKSTFNDAISDTSRQNLSELDNNTYHQIVFMEKDIEILKEKVQYLKDSTLQILSASANRYDELSTQFQEIAGSINQLKIAVNQIEEKHQYQKQKASNWFWQFIVPILLAVVFFIFGIFTKSCSIQLPEISKQAERPNPEQYIDFNE